jgi:hypothetical protein
MTRNMFPSDTTQPASAAVLRLSGIHEVVFVLD